MVSISIFRSKKGTRGQIHHGIPWFATIFDENFRCNRAETLDVHPHGKKPWKNMVISSIPSHLICQTRWKNDAILEDLSKKKFPALP